MTRIRTRPARAALAAATVAPCLLLGAGVLAPASLAAPAQSGAVAASATLAAGASAPASIPAPVHRGALRITGPFRDGATVAASGLTWRAPALPRGLKLVSFAVGYTWQSCAPGGKQCRTAADSTATPYAARDYVVGHADTGRVLRVTETATEVVVPSAGPSDDFSTVTRSVTSTSATAVRRLSARQGAVDRVRQRDAGTADRLDGGVLPGRRPAREQRRTARSRCPTGSTTAAGWPCRPAACSTPASSRRARTGCWCAQRTGAG